MTYSITLSPSGRIFTVSEDETVLSAALRHEIYLPYSCNNGTCGTCKGRVVRGAVALQDYDQRALSESENQQGFTLLCRAVPQSDVQIEVQEVNLQGSMPPKILPSRVARIEKLAPDVTGLWLKLPEGEPFKFLPGQHIDLILRDGRRRSYSLANVPDASGLLELHIRHVPGGAFSSQVLGGLKGKELIRFRGPLGTFSMDEGSLRPVVLVAGGTGFAPIKSMLERCFQKQIMRPIELYWGVRTRADLYLQEQLKAWVENYSQFCYTPVLSEQKNDDGWCGRVGLVHKAVLEDHSQLGNYSAYICGPPAMISAARRDFSASGLPLAHFHADAFDSARDDTRNM